MVVGSGAGVGVGGGSLPAVTQYLGLDLNGWSVLSHTVSHYQASFR